MNGRPAPRAIPAFQVYAASRLADRNHRLMTPTEHGLRYLMELEIWVNGDVPADPEDLARVIGWTASDMKAALTGRVLYYFEQRGTVLVSPELEAYRQKLDANYAKRSEAGRQAIARINDKRRGESSSASNPTSNPTDAKYNTNQSSQNQFRKRSGLSKEEMAEHDDFLAGYEGEAPHERPPS